MVDPDDDAHGPAGPERAEEGWVSLADAASVTGCAGTWLLDRCRDGRLPSRSAEHRELIVPLATVRALVAGEISE